MSEAVQTEEEATPKTSTPASRFVARPPVATPALGAVPAREHEPASAWRWRAFALLAVAFVMTIVDLTIVNVALPTIGRKLRFPEADLQWVVTAYALTFGGFLLLGGRAADLLGRRRLLMAGTTVFTGASLACALAAGYTFLIVMRGVQGLGAALMLPAALSIVMNMFAEGPERNQALGIWGGIGAGAATVGLLAGGVLTRYAGWEYIFFLNVPIGAAVMAFARRVVPESRLSTSRRRYDPLGAVSVTGGLVSLVYAISQAPQVGWGAAQTVVLLTASAVLLSAFVLVEARSDAPLLPLHLFQRGDHRRGQRGRLPARGQFLQLHLRRHPVHAAGARLFGAEDRGGLAGRLPHLGRPGRFVPDARHQDLGQDGHGGRDGAHWYGGCVGEPSAGSWPLLGTPGGPILRGWRRHRLRLHTGLDRSAGRRGRGRRRRGLGPAQHLPTARGGDRGRCRFDSCGVSREHTGPPWVRPGCRSDRWVQLGVVGVRLRWPGCRASRVRSGSAPARPAGHLTGANRASHGRPRCPA